MSHVYEIQLNGQTYKVDISRAEQDGLLIVRVNNQSFRLRPVSTKDGILILNDGTTDHRLRVLKRMGNRVHIDLDGLQREVSWSRFRQTESKTAQTNDNNNTSSVTKVAGGVYPPMPGRITEVRVRVGDQVKVGDTVCILEAMKMFNELKAPTNGTVKQVNVQSGSSVTIRDLLVLIE